MLLLPPVGLACCQSTAALCRQLPTLAHVTSCGGLEPQVCSLHKQTLTFSLLPPLSVANTKGVAPLVQGYVGRQLGEPGLKPTVRVGEAAMREVAAYLLDHDRFAHVPHTVLCKVTHPCFHMAPTPCVEVRQACWNMYLEVAVKWHVPPGNILQHGTHKGRSSHQYASQGLSVTAEFQ